MKTFDKLGLLGENVEVTATASSTPVEIEGLNIGEASYEVVINASDVEGTVDNDNYFTLQVEVSDSATGTFRALGNSIKLPATAAQYQIGFTSTQADRFFRVTVTQTGTTATKVVYTAFVSRV